ncbi:hypothetical protein HK104_002497 [Borealophlyctis nickersoniae]|nr:hypothetical protein HK104_002497 [Borealophlyctis nickersoniae]
MRVKIPQIILWSNLRPDMAYIYKALDGILLTTTSPAWTPIDFTLLNTWLTSYLTWLRTSARGLAESASLNNHGTWYDVQLCSILIYLNRSEECVTRLTSVTLPRLSVQIAADGSQPLETARPTSWSYSVFNLEAMFALARIAEGVGVDLWRYQMGDGRGVKKMLDFLLPFALRNGSGWPYNNTGGYRTDKFSRLCEEAFVKYGDVKYVKAAAAMEGGEVDRWETNWLWAPYTSSDGRRHDG